MGKLGFKLGHLDPQNRLFSPIYTDSLLIRFSSSQVLKLEISKVFLIAVSPSSTFGDGLLISPSEMVCWYHLLKDMEIVPFSLPTDIILLRPFLMSHMNHCNSLLTGVQSLPHPTLWRELLVLKSKSKKAQPIHRTSRPYVSRALKMCIPLQSVILFLWIYL